MKKCIWYLKAYYLLYMKRHKPSKKLIKLLLNKRWELHKKILIMPDTQDNRVNTYISINDLLNIYKL